MTPIAKTFAIEINSKLDRWNLLPEHIFESDRREYVSVQAMSSQSFICKLTGIQWNWYWIMDIAEFQYTTRILQT